MDLNLARDSFSAPFPGGKEEMKVDGEFLPCHVVREAEYRPRCIPLIDYGRQTVCLPNRRKRERSVGLHIWKSERLKGATSHAHNILSILKLSQ